MSAPQSANIDLGLATSRFNKGASDVKKGFTEIESTGKSSMSKLKGSIDTTNQSLDETDKKAKKAKDGVNSLGGAVLKAGASVVGFTSNITSLAYAYGDLNDSQLKIRQSNLSVARAQEDVNKLQREGKMGTAQYQFALEKLSLEQEKQKKTLEDADKQQVQFMANMATMAFTTVPAFVSSLGVLKGAHLGGAAATSVSTGANLGFTASLAAGTAAVWASFTALLHHPWFAPAAAATAGIAVGLIANNVWGIRDAILGANKAVDASTKALQTNNKELEKGSDSYLAYGDSTEQATKKVVAFGEGLTSLSSAFDILTFSLQGQGKPADTVLKGWEKAIRETKEQLKELNKEAEELKKNDNFDFLVFQYQNAQGMAWTRELIELGIERFNAGDLAGALEVEKALQTIGRNTSTKSGTLRSINDQIKQNAHGWSVIKNIGGGVGNLFGSALSASGLTGIQSTGILGMLNLPGLKSMRVSNFMKKSTGLSAAGFVSAKLSGGTNSISGVSKGGSRASGRSSKHGGSNRVGKNQRAAAAAKLDQRLQGITGYTMQELTNITGLQLFTNVHFGESGRTALSGNFGSIERYRQAQANIIMAEDAIRRQVAANVAEVEARASLLNQLSVFAGDANILNMLGGTAGFKYSSTTLTNLLNQQTQRAKDYSAKLGLPQSEILALYRTASGFEDLNNMTRFRDREIAAATSA